MFVDRFADGSGEFGKLPSGAAGATPAGGVVEIAGDLVAEWCVDCAMFCAAGVDGEGDAFDELADFGFFVFVFFEDVVEFCLVVDQKC